MQGVLEGALEWEVPHVAAAVVDRSGTIASTGTGDRPFALASVTKPLAAYACLVAVEEETISLDEPAGPPGSTVRHLLAHASGLGPDGKVLSAPERSRIYTNAAFDELAAHLSRAAGMPAADYVQEAVIDPLGMAGTDLRDGDLAKGARSDVDSLARFAAELLAPTLIDARTLSEATTVQWPDLDGVLPGFGSHSPCPWGLGLEIRGAKSPHWTGTRNSARTYGHFGASGTFLWVDPEPELALIVLTDREFGEWAVQAWPRLGDQVLEAAAERRSG